MEILYVVRILFLTTLAFVFTFLWTPLLTNFLYRHKLGKTIRNNGNTPIFTQLHAHKSGTPTMGGILVWVTTLVFALFLFLLHKIFNKPLFDDLNFLTRQETLLPLGALFITALIGLFDDWLDIRGKGVLGGGGFRKRDRLMFYTLIALAGAWWFFYKLNWTVLHIPFLGNYEIGWWYIPFFIFIIIGTAFSVNETDGLDGLAGGVLLIAYGSFAVISFILGRYDLAAFCGVIIGALLAFLWYNINPARFFMGDTGSMSLGVTLGIIAMLTNYALLLPLIGFIFVIEALSYLGQITWRKLFKKKLLLSAPIHHHFQAKGWPEPKVVMRFWLVSGVVAVVGLIFFFLDRTIMY